MLHSLADCLTLDQSLQLLKPEINTSDTSTVDHRTANDFLGKNAERKLKQSYKMRLFQNDLPVAVAITC